MIATSPPSNLDGQLTLRQLIASALRHIEEEPASLDTGSHQLHLAAGCNGLQLDCSLAFGKPFSDALLKSILEFAMADLKHFQARLLIDQNEGGLRLVRQALQANEDEVWYACEQMANQADVWMDVVCQQIWLEGQVSKGAGRNTRATRH